MLQFRKKVFLILGFAGILFLGGCSYREWEDSLRSELSDMPDGRQHKPSEDDAVVEDNEAAKNDGTMEPEVPKIPETEEEGLYGLGDTVVFRHTAMGSEGKKGQMSYTVESVAAFENIGDSGLERDDFSDLVKESIGEDGTFGEGYILLLLTVRVQNIDIPVDAEREAYPFMVEHWLTNRSQLDDPINGLPMAELCYFSGHPNENQAQDYSKFLLEEGEEMEMQVGWIVPAFYRDEPFYYVLNREFATEKQYWIELEISTEE